MSLIKNSRVQDAPYFTVKSSLSVFALEASSFHITLYASKLHVMPQIMFSKSDFQWAQRKFSFLAMNIKTISVSDPAQTSLYTVKLKHSTWKTRREKTFDSSGTFICSIFWSMAKYLQNKWCSPWNVALFFVLISKCQHGNWSKMISMVKRNATLSMPACWSHIRI